MTDEVDGLVFDTGPLRHFAHQGWLRLLQYLAGDRAIIIPESVHREIDNQIHEQSSLAQIRDASWITVDRSDDLPFLAAFARYEDRLVVDGKNRGECGVLALGASRGHELVLDDSVARQIAQDDGLRVTSTLALLCRAIRDQQLTVPMVEKLADDLLSGDYYLPFGAGGFRQWALQEGLIEYE